MFHNLQLPAGQAVRDSSGVILALSRRMMEFCSTKCRRFLLSPCDYDLFAKVKKTTKNGHADGVQCLPNIWQKVINNVGNYTEGT